MQKEPRPYSMEISGQKVRLKYTFNLAQSARHVSYSANTA